MSGTPEARGERGAVLITGASSGIGEAAAIRLRRSGFHVFGGYRRDEDGGRLSSAGVKPVRLDVTDPDSVESARDEIHARSPGTGLVGLVNNAGVPGAGAVELTPPDEYRRVLEVNFFGVIAVTQAFLPMLRLARGRIVMVSSISGLFSSPFMSPYAASKFALEALSDSLRRELLPEGMDVILVEPGPILTRIWERVDEFPLERYRGTPYEERAGRFEARVRESARTALPVGLAARAVERALTRRRPPSRMLITAPRGRLQIRLIRWLPDRIVDRLILSRF